MHGAEEAVAAGGPRMSAASTQTDSMAGERRPVPAAGGAWRRRRGGWAGACPGCEGAAAPPRWGAGANGWRGGEVVGGGALTGLSRVSSRPPGARRCLTKCPEPSGLSPPRGACQGFPSPGVFGQLLPSPSPAVISQSTSARYRQGNKVFPPAPCLPAVLFIRPFDNRCLYFACPHRPPHPTPRQNDSVFQFCTVYI